MASAIITHMYPNIQNFKNFVYSGKGFTVYYLYLNLMKFIIDLKSKMTYILANKLSYMGQFITVHDLKNGIVGSRNCQIKSSKLVLL